VQIDLNLKIRTTEEFEEIELGWHGTGKAEQPLAPARAPQADACAAVRVGADVTEVAQDSEENTSAVVAEPLKVKAAPTVGPQPEDPLATGGGPQFHPVTHAWRAAGDPGAIPAILTSPRLQTF